MANKYELMGARIEEVFAAAGIHARVWQAHVTPRFVSFQATSALATRAAKIKNLPEDMALHLGVQSVRIKREGGIWLIQVPRDTPRTVSVPEVAGMTTVVGTNTGLLGIDEEGAPLLIRIDSPDVAHIFIAGTTGSGKTELLRTLLLSFVMYNRPAFLQLALIDPMADKFAPLTALPHMWRNSAIASEPADAARLLAALAAEMDNRARTGRTSPRIIIAIDELADVIQSQGHKEAITEPLQRLVQRGRGQGLHVIAATQKPAATLVGGLVKANFPTRIVGSVVSADDAKVAAGVGDSGAEKLLGRGDFVLIVKGAKLRFQAPYNDPWEYDALVALIAAGQADRHRRAWSQAALEQGIREARKPALRRLLPVAQAVADLVPVVREPVRQGGALVPYSHTHSISSPVEQSSVTDPAVHRPAPPVHLAPNGAAPAGLAFADARPALPGEDLPPFWSRVAPASADASPAPLDDAALTPQKGALPRRPDGPSAVDAAEIKAAYSRLGSLNKTCDWAYGSKGPLTLFWIKSALLMPEQSAPATAGEDTDGS